MVLLLLVVIGVVVIAEGDPIFKLPDGALMAAGGEMMDIILMATGFIEDLLREVAAAVMASTGASTDPLGHLSRVLLVLLAGTGSRSIIAGDGEVVVGREGLTYLELIPLLLLMMQVSCRTGL